MIDARMTIALDLPWLARIGANINSGRYRRLWRCWSDDLRRRPNDGKILCGLLLSLGAAQRYVMRYVVLLMYRSYRSRILSIVG